MESTIHFLFRKMCLLLSIWMVINRSSGVKLNESGKVELYINKLISEFQGKPEDVKFCLVIHPPLPQIGSSKAEYFLPKVLLWSPQEHFGIILKCPVHSSPLHPVRWTKTVSGNMANNARLIYDLHGNIILVQRIYNCNNDGIAHQMRSTSFDVHNCLSRTIQLFFPIQVFQRSACSKHLLQYIKTQILQGVKFFIKISEGLAALNFQEFCRQRRIYLTAATENNELVESSSSSEFYSNVLFSFPSNDQIMNLFLIGFKMESHLYNNEMNSLSATVISCDHTFKISRNVGLVRGDNKFVTQYNQLFIALNERGEVLCWKMTTSTSFTQIEDLLTDLRGELT